MLSHGNERNEPNAMRHLTRRQNFACSQFYDATACRMLRVRSMTYRLQLPARRRPASGARIKHADTVPAPAPAPASEVLTRPQSAE
jgi:hypothetical protein